MRIRLWAIALALAIVSAPLAGSPGTQAQPARKVWRIGDLSAITPSDFP